MSTFRKRWLGAGLLLGFFALAAAASPGSGSIAGRISLTGGQALAGVRVHLEESGISTDQFTDADGRFAFENVRPGTYAVTFTLGAYSGTEEGVIVTAGSTSPVEKVVDWETSFADSLTVVAVSRHPERMVEAPAAVITMDAEGIERESAHGQLPKLLEFTNGVELTQSGIYDFNLNVRGFGGPINRRVLVLIDGRDPSLPLLGSQEWPALSFPLYDLESLELVQGPSTALYGTNAFNGVLNLTTKSAIHHPGGMVQVTAGDLDTQRLDFRAAGPLWWGWHGKVVGGAQRSGDFKRSRVASTEYPGLPTEAIPLVQEDVEVAFGGLRLDRQLGGLLMSLEGGTATYDGTIAVTTIGRVQITESRRPWARLSLGGTRWNLLTSHTRRDAPGLVTLANGGASVNEESRTSLELQGHAGFASGRGLLVGGLSRLDARVDTANDQGVQTVLSGKRDEQRRGAFAQADYRITDRLRGVLALRLDDSTVYDRQLSPKAALVYALGAGHTLRLTYNEAFQSPNFAEYFAKIAVAPSVDLSPVEQALAPVLGGQPLGFGDIPILAVGNEALDLEEITTAELGYSGILGRRLLLTVDLYRSEVESFVSTLLPQVGTSLGRLNPRYLPYSPPAGLSPEARSAVLATLQAVLPPGLFALLSNDESGAPVFAALSFTNVGRVDAQGAQARVLCDLGRSWQMSLGYSWFDFEVRDEAAENPVLPNAPEHQVNAGLAYTGGRFDAALHWRWSDGYPWRSGVFAGPVPSYSVMDVGARYHFDDRWTVGVDASNVLDERHYEIFGGDILRRRVLASLSYSW